METWGTSCFNMHFQNHSLGTLEIQTALGFKNSFMVENMYFFIAYIISNFKARAGNSTLSYTINWKIFCYCFVNASTSSYWIVLSGWKWFQKAFYCTIFFQASIWSFISLPWIYFETLIKFAKSYKTLSQKKNVASQFNGKQNVLNSTFGII